MFQISKKIEMGEMAVCSMHFIYFKIPNPFLFQNEIKVHSCIYRVSARKRVHWLCNLNAYLVAVAWVQAMFFNQWGIIIFYVALIVSFLILETIQVLYDPLLSRFGLMILIKREFQISGEIFSYIPRNCVYEWYRYILLEILSSTAPWLLDRWRNILLTSLRVHGHLTCTWVSSFVSVYLSGNDTICSAYYLYVLLTKDGFSETAC